MNFKEEKNITIFEHPLRYHFFVIRIQVLMSLES